MKTITLTHDEMRIVQFALLNSKLRAETKEFKEAITQVELKIINQTNKIKTK